MLCCFTLHVDASNGCGAPRLWEKALHVEIEWSVGPIPIDDNKGKEVVLRYASSLDTGMCALLCCMQCGRLCLNSSAWPMDRLAMLHLARGLLAAAAAPAAAAAAAD